MISKGFFISLSLTLSLFTTNIYAENNYRLKTYEAPFYQGTTHKIFQSWYGYHRGGYNHGYHGGYRKRSPDPLTAFFMLGIFLSLYLVNRFW